MAMADRSSAKWVEEVERLMCVYNGIAGSHSTQSIRPDPLTNLQTFEYLHRISPNCHGWIARRKLSFESMSIYQPDFMQSKPMSISRHVQSSTYIMSTCAYPWLGQIGHRRKPLSLLRPCYVNNMGMWTPNVSPISCTAEILEYCWTE